MEVVSNILICFSNNIEIQITYVGWPLICPCNDEQASALPQTTLDEYVYITCLYNFVFLYLIYKYILSSGNFLILIIINS